jgi:hypothetical protein
MRSGWRIGVAGCVFSTSVLGWVPPASAGQVRRASLTPPDAAAAERARNGAARRLGNAECRRVFSDFRDLRGRTIERKLEEWAVNPVDYLRTMPFLDGSGEPLCHRSKVMLVSSPDVPRVVVCPAFARLQRDQPRVAESLVIHELLHTLGLGENPPTPAEITSRVEARCR